MIFQFDFSYFYDGRHHGQDGYGYEQQFGIVLDKRQVSEEVAGIAKCGNPQGSTDDVVGHEVPVVHFSHSCNEGRESTYDGQEASYDNGLSTVAVEKIMGLFEGGGLEEPGTGVAEHFFTEVTTGHIVA